MGEHKDYKFYVIELFEPPYTDPERFVCVPNSWVRLRETSDGVAIVKFPIEELSEIKKRAKNEEFSNNWTIFLADIKYGANYYEEASNYTNILNKTFVQEQNSTIIVEDTPSTSPPSSRTNEIHAILTPSNDAELKSMKTPEQTELTDTVVQVCQKKIKVGAVDSPPKARKYLTRQSLRMSSSVNNTFSLLDQTARENHRDTSNYAEESDKNNHNQGNESSVKNCSELTRKCKTLVLLRSVLGDNFREVLEQLYNEHEKNHLTLDKMRLAFMRNCEIIKEFIKLSDEVNNGTILVVLQSVFGDNFRELLEQLHNEFEKNHLMLDKMRFAFIRNCNIIKEFIELTDEVNNGPDISDLGAKVKELEKSMMEMVIEENNDNEVTGSKIQNDARKEQVKKHNSDCTEVKNDNPLNKIRGKARKFTLPPEYDPNDSRWTLKHREHKKGLVELLPLSRVYIDAIKLDYCKSISKDSKTLARMLLLEIFTENALSICSLTGKKANAYDLEGTSVRPGLDENARTILLNYVEKHAIEQKWDKFNRQIITNTLRNKMQQKRGKCE